MGTIRILLVDDHPVVREGLAAVLRSEPDFRIAGEAADGKSALEVAARVRPALALVDVNLPDQSGIELCKRLRTQQPGMRVLLISTQADELTIAAGFNAGARGYVMKTSEPSLIRQAVRAVAAGEEFVDPALEARRDAFSGNRKVAKGPFGLTPQEMRVLEQLPRGLTNRAIGDELHITEDTVKTHIKHILVKLNANDRAEAVAIALRAGLL